MTTPSPFAGLTYEVRDDDLVRYQDHPVDDALSTIVRSLCDSRDERREDVRRGFNELERDVLAIFARRRTLHARRTQSTRALSDALDAYALLPREYDVPWESWFKAALYVAREVGLDLDGAAARFFEIATAKSVARARVAFDAMARIDTLIQCHVIPVSTTYGAGMLETTVVRDQGVASWGGITGQPVSLGQFQVDYAPTTNLAQLAVTIADALDASGLVTCSPLRQDQLVATTFDLVTSGSYVDSLGCLNFFADSRHDQVSFSVHVAEVATEEHDGVRFDADALSRELADAADDIEGQSALVTGPCVVVLSVLPAFDDEVADETADLSAFLDLVARAIAHARDALTRRDAT
ncbi:MAG: hypothetical protein HIU57_09805 [Acidobacteria bacterium]|nr:hypothetical protein [Acidobacteriota bacterium]